MPHEEPHQIRDLLLIIDRDRRVERNREPQAASTFDISLADDSERTFRVVAGPRLRGVDVKRDVR